MVLSSLMQKCLLILPTYLAIPAVLLTGFITSLPASAADPAPPVKEIRDFQAVAQAMQTRKLPLLLEFRADYCGYCRQLEKDYLEPMERSGQYDQRILLKRFTVDTEDTITDFNGETIEAEDFIARYHGSLTPTLVFLDATGKPVAEPLRGYNSPDFYGAYLENAIEQAYKAVQPAEIAPTPEKHGASPTTDDAPEANK